MTLPPQHRLTLAFRDPLLEGRFRRRYTHDALGPARWAALFATILYSVVYAFNDWLVVPYLLREAWTVRAVVGVLGIAVFAASFRPWFRRVWQQAFSAVLAAAGVGLIYLLAIDPGPVSSGFGFNGPALLILAGYVLFRLRFVWATAVGWSIVAAYVFVGLFVRADVPTGRFVGSLLFFCTANGVGMFAAYVLERYVRRLFVQAETLDEKRRENARLLDARSRFFQNVSHELRTPLALIAGPVQRVLAEEPLAPAVRDDLVLVDRAATRLRGLVDELLDLARLEAGHLTLAVAEHDLAAYVESLVASFEPLAAQKRVALRFAADGVPQPAWFDPGKLDRAVLNLLSNAVKFTPEGGLVEVRVWEEDGRVGLDVRDTGPGIDADDLPHIFDRFHRARATESVPGTGLGLPLVRALARLHGGDVEVASAPGLGARFRLWMPAGADHVPPERLAAAPPALAAPAAAPALGAPSAAPALDAPALDTSALDASALAAPALDAPAEPPAEMPPSAWVRALPPSGAPGAAPTAVGPEAASDAPAGEGEDTRPLVLVVDDSADMRAFVARVLGDGFRIEQASDGLEALDHARALVPDLVVSDLMMPRLDGLGFVDALRHDPALDHVPVVMLTARTSDEARLDGLRAGVDEYLGKPFRPEELRARVDNLLARQRRLRARFGADLHPPSRSLHAAMQATPVDVTDADTAFMERARAAVEAAVSNEMFGVDDLADALGLSRRQLERKLRALADVSPNTFIRLIRLSRAGQLLAGGFGTVSEVAYAVGMSPSHFARVFREHYGVVPSEWTG